MTRWISSCVFLLLLGEAVLAPAQEQLPVPRRGEALRVLSAECGLAPAPGEPVKCGFPIRVAASLAGRRLSSSGTRSLAVLSARPQLDTSVLRSGYRIHFDTVGFNAPALLNAQGARIPGTALAFVDSVGTALARVTAVEVGELGYPPPPTDGMAGGGPELDLYIMELGNSYGETDPDVDVTPGGTTTSFLTIDNDFSFVQPDSNRGIPGMKVTVAHEFHHAIQLGCYGFWPDDVYFYEITSVWLEDVVYTGVNDYYNYLRASFSHFRNPNVPFTTNDLIMYSRGIWGQFVAKQFGAGAMKRSWEEVRASRPLPAIDAALHDYGSSFTEAFAEWTKWNYYTGNRADTAEYYAEGNFFPEIAQLPIEFSPPSTSITNSLFPFGSRYHQVLLPSSSGFDSLTIAVTNENLSAAEFGTGADEGYIFRLSTNRPDDSYRETGTSVYAQFSTDVPAHWGIWFLVGENAVQPFGRAALSEGTPFPNPYLPDGRSVVSIPVDATREVEGSLQIYSAAMELVYASGQQFSTGVGRQVFLWRGITSDGAPAPTGVYVFLLTLSDGRRVTGKIALIRK